MLDIRFTKEKLDEISKIMFGRDFDKLAGNEKYRAVSQNIMAVLSNQWIKSEEEFKDKKKAYYLSAEFLMGRALGNNIINLKVDDTVRAELDKLGEDLYFLEENEADAGLGNGGLGRLAACFLDSAATLNYPLMGYGIRYEYGIFKQLIVNGKQIEMEDNWGAYTDPWSIRHEEQKVLVKFNGQEVYAVPYDTPIIGYGGDTINTLRLFASEPKNVFDFNEFNIGRYQDSVREKVEAETISRVLYPNDDTWEGKRLRLKQQYFFVSASLQDMIRKYLVDHDNLDEFHKFHAIQLNDTHPTVAVPELIRLLMTEHGYIFEKAFEITLNTLAYTNHTILQEALEKWDIELFRGLIPNVYEVVEMIQRRLEIEMTKKGLSHDEIKDISIISDGVIKMAYLAIYGSHSTNGVAALHTDILKDKELNNWYKIYPERFNNKTNGITQRRWLLRSNRELSAYITELLGTDEWIVNLDLLKNLEKFANDDEVIKKFMGIKLEKKKQLADYIKYHENMELDTESIFDIQVKRLHEYKRQFLNALHILDLYYRIKAGEKMKVKRTFIFGGKAAPGYRRAKGIIQFINEVKRLVEEDKEASKWISVLFVENFTVSYGEKLYPAADISEQISTTGKEASGTGNMKFMLNGACTIGTLDGANVEIVEEAGIENNFIFGLKIEEINALYGKYDPKKYYNSVKGLKKVVDTLIDGTISDGGTGVFEDLHNSLINGQSWESPDNYFLLYDFEEYRQAQEKICEAYEDKINFYRKCFINMANAGKFSSDRTIKEYANEIWDIKVK